MALIRIRIGQGIIGNSEREELLEFLETLRSKYSSCCYIRGDDLFQKLKRRRLSFEVMESARTSKIGTFRVRRGSDLAKVDATGAALPKLIELWEEADEWSMSLTGDKDVGVVRKEGDVDYVAIEGNDTLIARAQEFVQQSNLLSAE